MQPAHCVMPLAPLGCLDDIQQLIRRSLLGNWVIRIEYADDGVATPTGWQAWGKPLFAVRDASPVIEAILACRASFPHHAIRLTAERVHPETRLVYWVVRPQHQPAQRPPLPVGGHSANQAAVPLCEPGSRLSAARSALWRYVVPAGMVLASVLWFEQALLA